MDSILSGIDARNTRIGVIGLGYVGLPLAVASAEAGFRTTGFDVDPAKAVRLNGGSSYIDAVDDERLNAVLGNGRFKATSDEGLMGECDILIICVPTPLTKQREPDMSYIDKTARAIVKTLRKGQTVVLESTTYPGTTSEFLTPLLETSGLKAGVDFFVGFSPEREDPGNRNFRTTTIPKVVAGDGETASAIVERFYGAVVEQVVPVSSTATAEAVKISENIFRAVNIALVNELKTVFEPMGVDIWEVVKAADTKPFGYMAFYPGPGLGGHCIPIDPYYLTWRAREFDITTRFIELAGEVNRSMPSYVVKRTEEALDRFAGKSLGRSKILLLGLAYKKNVSDMRESPAFKIIELLEDRGTQTNYHDPHIDVMPMLRDHADYAGRRSVPMDLETLDAHDAVIVVTDHDDIDWKLLEKTAAVVIDTRNVVEREGLFVSRFTKA